MQVPFSVSFLDELRARTPLAALVARRAKLIRSGRNWKACCPAHDEKTPSFYVYDDHFHCFGCGFHGDAIMFVMQTQSLTFEKAVAELAAEAGLQKPVASPGLTGSRLEVDAHGGRSPPLPTAPHLPLGKRPVITNESKFTDIQIDSLLGTSARLLVRKKLVTAASILANAGGRLTHWEHDNWNGGQDSWRLTLSVPTEVYLDLEGREEIEKAINGALATAMEAVSDADHIWVKIVTSLEEDPNWRQMVRQHLSGEGITNQGRVRSDNIAAREHDGLLFRSSQEIHVYNALKSTGLPFAPLSVVLHGGIKYRRVEPDFVVFKDGLVMVVEIDGDLYHTETPAAAHARLKFIVDEGVRLERITATECDTPEKAREAVQRIIATIDKLRRAR